MLGGGSLDDGATAAGGKKGGGPSRSSSSYGGRDSKPRPATQDSRSPTGTSFGDKMELRPGTSVAPAASDEWAAPRHPSPTAAKNGGNSSSSRESDASSSPRSVSSVDSADTYIASGAADTLTPASVERSADQSIGLEVESLSDTSTPSVSPTLISGKMPLGLYPPPDMPSPGVHALSAARDEYTRPSSAVRLYRPSSRKAHAKCSAVTADGQPTGLSSPAPPSPSSVGAG